MLDLRREGHFRYDLREVLSRSAFPPEQAAGFVATIVSKGSRLSTAEAKAFVDAKLGEKLLSKPDRDAILHLLDRYSRWR